MIQKSVSLKYEPSSEPLQVQADRQAEHQNQGGDAETGGGDARAAAAKRQAEDQKQGRRAETGGGFVRAGRVAKRAALARLEDHNQGGGAESSGGDARAGRQAAAKQAALTRLQGFFDPAAAGAKLRYNVQPGDEAVVQVRRYGFRF